MVDMTPHIYGNHHCCISRMHCRFSIHEYKISETNNNDSAWQEQASMWMIDGRWWITKQCKIIYWYSTYKLELDLVITQYFVEWGSQIY